MKNLNYLTNHILHQVFKIFLSISIFKKHGEKTDNPSIKIYVNPIENRIKFKIKTGYHLKLLTLKKMKLLGSTKCKITKDIIGKKG